MQSFHTLEQRIRTLLERHDGKCLDNETEREELIDDLFDMLDRYLGERGP